MNIAIDIRALATVPRTGVGEYTFELLKAVFLSYPEHIYYLISSGKNKISLPENWQKPNIILLHLPMSNRLLNIFMWFFKWPRLTDWPKLLNVTAPKFDLLYLPNLNFAPFDSQTKTIVTVHDISFELFPKFFSYKQRFWHWALQPRRLLNSSTRIITPSYNTRRDVIQYYGVPEQKVTAQYPMLSLEFTVPSEAEINQVKNKYNLPENFILFLGTFEPRKNILALVYAFQELQKKNSSAQNIKLVLTGAPGWKNKNIKKIIATDKNIISIGYVDDTNKHALYRSARVFVYPSFYEGFGLPVLEAMAVGTPVITSNRSSLVEVAGTAAYLINPDRIDELVTGLEKILFDSELRTLYQTRGFAQAQKFIKQKPPGSLISFHPFG